MLRGGQGRTFVLLCAAGYARERCRSSSPVEVDQTMKLPIMIDIMSLPGGGEIEERKKIMNNLIKSFLIIAVSSVFYIEGKSGEE